MGGRILRARVEIPAEPLMPGPRGHRVQVIDYDAAAGKLHRPARLGPKDPFETAGDDRLLADYSFHALNAYAIAMRTLARFEFALGRRVPWGCSSHQIRIAPHAFQEANAYYSPRDGALAFGYFPGRDRAPVYACLSHDVAVHETAHALLDGLRRRYRDPSSPDQAAFHEGFADCVALLSVFSLTGVVETVLGPARIPPARLTPEKLRRSVLFALAEQLGQEISAIRGRPLRQSALLQPSPDWLRQAPFQEPHRRGEILVAAVMNAFLEVWLRRLTSLGRSRLDRERVAEEAARAASHLLTICIRGLDYAPPTDLLFSDYLSALLTADREIQPDDSRYLYRRTLLASFAAYGIRPTSRGDSGVWEPPEASLVYDGAHFESLQRAPEEVFRFLWENRRRLRLCEDAYTRVQSVRPCIRVGPDGFLLRETVAEYVQSLTLRAAELMRLGIRRPTGMPAGQEITLYGGGALIFDEFGQLKFHARNRIDNARRQTARLAYLWERPHLGFAAIHRLRRIQLP